MTMSSWFGLEGIEGRIEKKGDAAEEEPDIGQAPVSSMATVFAERLARAQR